MDTTKILLKIMPSFLRKKIEDKKELRKILDNINWLTFERIFQMILGIFVMAWVARYLGPENFGLMNYALAFVGLFAVLYKLGLDNIVVRNIVKNPKKEKDYLGTTFLLKSLGSILLIILTYIGITLVRPETPILHLFVIIVSIGFLFKTAETVDLWFQSQVLSKYRVYAKSVAFASSALLRIALIFLAAPLVFFVVVVAIEQVITAVGLFILYHKKGRTPFKKWKFKTSTAKDLLKDSWPLILSGIAITINMKIDQVMIGKMIGDSALGIYSAAVKLSEAWYFIPTFIAISVFPQLIKAKKKSEELYHKKLSYLYKSIISLALVIAVIVTLSSKIIIRILYGVEYMASAGILSVHIWAGIFVFLGVIWSRWILIQNKQKLITFSHISAAVMNVCFNLILLPVMSIYGAALASLLSYSLSSFIAILLYNPKTTFNLIFKSNKKIKKC